MNRFFGNAWRFWQSLDWVTQSGLVFTVVNILGYLVWTYVLGPPPKESALMIVYYFSGAIAAVTPFVVLVSAVLVLSHSQRSRNAEHSKH
ncbi:MAG: hypothetical protein V4474_01870 [Patescibacteria group bacterium]